MKAKVVGGYGRDARMDSCVFTSEEEEAWEIRILVLSRVVVDGYEGYTQEYMQ
jgi:hypothetical protein